MHEKNIQSNSFYFNASLIIFFAFILLPQAICNNWFFLDVPTLYAFSLNKNFVPLPDPISGRHLLFYQIFYKTAIYIFGPYPRSFFILQAVFLTSCVYVLFCSMKNCLIFPRKMYLLLLCALVTCSAAEVYATVGKNEFIVSGFFCLAIAICLYYKKTKNPKILFCTLVITMLSYWSKETSQVLVVLFLVYEGLRWFNNFPEKEKRGFKLPASTGSLIGFLVAAFVTKYLSPEKELNKTYLDYDINLKLVIENLKDYLYSVPSLFITLCLALFLLLFLFPRIRNIYSFLSAACFISGLTYLSGLLFWKWAMPYYILIPEMLFSFSIIFSYFCTHGQNEKSLRIIRNTAIIIFSYISATSFINFFYFSSAQKIVAELYTIGIDSFVEKINENPQNKTHTLIMADFPKEHEAIVQTSRLLKEYYNVSAEVQGMDALNELLNNKTIPGNRIFILHLSSNFSGVTNQNLRCISPNSARNKQLKFSPLLSISKVKEKIISGVLPCASILHGISMTQYNASVEIYDYSSNQKSK